MITLSVVDIELLFLIENVTLLAVYAKQKSRKCYLSCCVTYGLVQQ